MPPNVLIIVVDALRTDRVGALGGRELTPAIDELADDATIFQNAFTTANATDPAITSLHTGQYPLSHGVVNHGSRVTDSEKRAVQQTMTLPSILQNNGYYTAKLGRPLGRWHRRGFDRYPELSGSHWRLKRFEKWASARLHSVSPMIGRLGSRVHSKVTGGRSSEETAVDTLQSELRELIDRTAPFYAFVHLMDPHTPYDVENNLVEECLDRFEYENEPLDEVVERFPAGSITHSSLRPGGVVNRFEERWRNSEYGIGTAVASAHYDAAVREADRTVGTILNLLREASVLDDTLVIVLADHGESLTEHEIYYDHHGLYDQTARIPLVIRPPGGGNTTCDELVQITDVMPTVLSYVEAVGLDESHGQSLRPVIEGEGSLQREAIVAEEANTQRRRMIRTHDEKAIFLVEGDVRCRYCEIVHAREEELYDLRADPAERVNLAEDRPDRLEELRERAEEVVPMVDHHESEDHGEAVEYDDEEEIMERLRTLGYR